MYGACQRQLKGVPSLTFFCPGFIWIWVMEDQLSPVLGRLKGGSITFCFLTVPGENRGAASSQNRSVVMPVLVLNLLTHKKNISDTGFPVWQPLRKGRGPDRSTHTASQHPYAAAWTVMAEEVEAAFDPHPCPQHQPRVLFISVHSSLTKTDCCSGDGKPAQSPARPGSQHSFAIISEINLSVL